MKRLCILFLACLYLLLCLCACAPAAVENTAPSTEPSTEPVTEANTQPTETTAPPEPVYVYEKAVQEFLTPLDSYSTVREQDPEFVMIHFISAVVPNRTDPYNIQAVRSIFADYNVSVHYVVQRDGTVYCYIPEDRVAWHAGAGEFMGDPKYTNRMNHYAIGIEVIGIGSQADMSIYLTASEYRALDPSLIGFTEAQYQALKPLVDDLCKRYEIPQDAAHVIGHEDYSPEKTDPGELFDWSRILPGT